LLENLRSQLDGAVAIVTGRSIGVVDDLLNPFVATAAGEHGASLRYQDGKLEEMPKGLAVPDAWREAWSPRPSAGPGVLVEPKPHGVAIHYRLVPERGNDVWRLVRALVPQDHPWFRLIPAREAVEIGPRAASKGHAVEQLMARQPFQGRRPIFVGDDFTDEAGMEAARQFGGQGLRVAEVFGGQPAAVRAWLSRGVELLSGRNGLACRVGGSGRHEQPRSRRHRQLRHCEPGRSARAACLARHRPARRRSVFNALLGGDDPQGGFMDVVGRRAPRSSAASATCTTRPSSRP
jgi:trehalose 6-phosphate phosphatase